MSMKINGYKIDQEKFYTVQKTAKILEITEMKIWDFIKRGLFLTDDRIGVYRRVAGVSLIDFVERPEIYSVKKELPQKIGFSLFNDLQNDKYLSKRLRNIRRRKDG